MKKTKSAPTIPLQSRSGSEKRQRGKPVSMRLLDDERATLESRATAAGLSLASYMRTASLGSAGIRARRAPTINAALLAEAVAQLRKAGSNVNQIARVLNAGQAAGWREAAEALTGINAAVRQILDLTGRRKKGQE